MKALLPQNLIRLAEALPAPLYLVGGSVRDFLSGYPLRASTDWDISSPAKEGEVLKAAEACGFTVRAVYEAMGTVKLEDGDGVGYEYTRFRSDKYVRGMHAPAEVCFTEDIATDARRRDFRANAVYYDIKSDTFCDPLGGMEDIREKRLTAVREAALVFGEDGLRLMRLARIAAEIGFAPDEACLAAAREHASLIGDIYPERVFFELRLLLHADQKHGDGTAVSRGLTILKETGVLGRLMPELTLGDGMEQNLRFHRYDVLEHSLRCCAYADPEIRFAALLHDVGKPYCYLRDGNFYSHPAEGARIAHEILLRLKAPKALIAETVFLVSMHMRDYDLQMRPSKVRQDILTCGEKLPLLLKLKQADFSACRDDFSPAPCVLKWEKELQIMREEGVPFTVKELAVNGRQLQEIGVPKRRTAEALKELLQFCLTDGHRNSENTLLQYAKNHLTGD